MDSKELEIITNSIQEKIGKENSALIADDLGVLITKNNETLETLHNKEEEITQLKNNNEKLVMANGKLLQSIPMTTHQENVKENPNSTFNFRDAFDENGHFKK